MAVLNVGSRTHGRDTFRYENHPWFSPSGPAFGCSNSFLTNLCAAKDKLVWNKFGRVKRARRVCARIGAKQQYPKERPPAAANALALLAFAGGRLKGSPYPSGNERNSFRSPSDCSRQKLRCSARLNGFEKRKTFSMHNADRDKTFRLTTLCTSQPRSLRLPRQIWMSGRANFVQPPHRRVMGRLPD